MKRKADDAHDRIPTQCRRATKELETAAEDLNDTVGHIKVNLTNEARNLREALDMIEEFQRRGSNRVGGASKINAPAVDEVPK